MHSHKKDVGVTFRKSGVIFRVWAPFADAVAVTGSFNDWDEQPLETEGDGYWAGEVRAAEAGQEYKFVIRNGEHVYHRNDPRALHFTTTPGNSVIASPQFDWGDDAFTPVPPEEQVIYEIHVGTFNRPDPAITGTFQDICERLDYLAELGINMLELMPISSMSMDRGWGYAIDYIFSVESLYGGRHGFLQMVREAHKRGIGVILDVVYNHFGPDTNLDLWQFDGWQEDDKGGIYFYNDWRAETPWGNTRPDFGRPEVRQYIIDNVRMWLHDCRVDGLRVDSTIFIRNVKGLNDDPEHDLPEGWHVLQELNTAAREINPAALTIAEDVGANEFIVKPMSEGGAGFSTQWELGFPHALQIALTYDDPAQVELNEITDLLTRRYNNNPFQRVIFSDSHDSAANGSARLWEIISPGDADNRHARTQSMLAAALLMTAPGIPMLFQGQEFMEGGSFNDWQALDWTKAELRNGIVEANTQLIALRRNLHGVSAGLTGGHIAILNHDDENKILAYHRCKDGGPTDDVVVVINFGVRSFENYELTFPRDGIWKIRFNSTSSTYSDDFKDVPIPDVVVAEGKGTITLPASSAVIFSQDN